MNTRLDRREITLVLIFLVLFVGPTLFPAHSTAQNPTTRLAPSELAVPQIKAHTDDCPECEKDAMVLLKLEREAADFADEMQSMAYHMKEAYDFYRTREISASSPIYNFEDEREKLLQAHSSLKYRLERLVGVREAYVACLKLCCRRKCAENCPPPGNDSTPQTSPKPPGSIVEHLFPKEAPKNPGRGTLTQIPTPASTPAPVRTPTPNA